MLSPSARPSARLLAGLVLALGLTACTGGDQQEARQAGDAQPRSTFTAQVPVHVPGAPGEEATVIAPGETGSLPDADAWGDADARFMTDMIVHHAQALEMTELASERASDQRVRALAGRIAAAQGPEIEAMSAWLQAHALPVPDVAASGAGTSGAHGGDHGGHADMPGMATPEELERLRRARGTAFDRLFLELMTRHHQGALTMAEDAATAQHPVVTDLVADVSVGQSVEIQRMQEVLEALPAA